MWYNYWLWVQLTMVQTSGEQPTPLMLNEHKKYKILPPKWRQARRRCRKWPRDSLLEGTGMAQHKPQCETLTTPCWKMNHDLPDWLLLLLLLVCFGDDAATAPPPGTLNTCMLPLVQHLHGRHHVPPGGGCLTLEQSGRDARRVPSLFTFTSRLKEFLLNIQFPV